MSAALFDLSGRTALITGSTRGIGKALARGLGAAGARVIISARDREQTSAVAASLRDEGILAHDCPFDVTDTEQVVRAVATCEAGFGPIDILVNNAGIQRRGPLLDLDPADWRAVMSTNLDAVFAVSREVARAMIPRGRGKIISIASLMSEVARPGTAPYAAAKGGVKMLTRAMCPWPAGQRHRARLFRNRTDRRARGRSGVRRLDPRPHPGGTLGAGGRPGRRRGIPGVRCLRLRQWPDALCRWRRAGGPLAADGRFNRHPFEAVTL